MPAPTSSHRSASQATEIDIATNEALLQHAEASRLAKSWLNGAFGDNSTSNAREDEQEEFEANLAKNAALYSENGGIGYTQPTDSSSTTHSSRASDPTTAFLRKQLLGRGSQRGNPHHHHATAKSRPGAASSAHRRRDSEDEEEGRSGLGKSKAGQIKNTSGTPNMSRTHPGDTSVGTTNAASNKSVEHTASGQGSHAPKSIKKRGSSYLDEILASRAAKKKKKSGKANDG